MSIVESIVKAVNDNIDHPRISTMIDIIKQEKTPGSYIRFTRFDSSDLLFTVKTEVHEQRIIVEVLVKENKEMILKEIIVEMISYYANYKEFDTIDISLRGR